MILIAFNTSRRRRPPARWCRLGQRLFRGNAESPRSTLRSIPSSRRTARRYYRGFSSHGRWVEAVAVLAQAGAGGDRRTWSRLSITDMTLRRTANCRSGNSKPCCAEIPGHPACAGRCRMSGSNDANGVVNPDGTVRASPRSASPTLDHASDCRPKPLPRCDRRGNARMMRDRAPLSRYTAAAAPSVRGEAPLLTIYPADAQGSIVGACPSPGSGRAAFKINQVDRLVFPVVERRSHI